MYGSVLLLENYTLTHSIFATFLILHCSLVLGQSKKKTMRDAFFAVEMQSIEKRVKSSTKSATTNET